MRRFVSLIALSLVSVAAWAASPVAGDKAPDFKLQDQNGKWHTLDTHKGQWLVLYFYPKDFTAGCTTEVCTYRDDTAKLHKAGAEVLGVSLDDVKSHQEFAEKYHVPFPLLSDADSSVATQYGVLSDMAGHKYARRETFLIDPSGKIVKVYKDVDPEKNSGQVLADIAALKGKGA
ncbi:peroxiredoxin [Luteibacter pinisoli]|jgi:peroxiredoxin Q/BCP|uniref:thioredoxin-dependent peroxiredoxin n=1 Tax=Luteibacter pinisoli TaxID=2589080 RepID=A0A4Y5YYR2_9GAMM|nr:peroxiredoxin [Luteibacter pinisoli]QDE38122.1 peroxiredoxin [Luteibacter pinisoli]